MITKLNYIHNKNGKLERLIARIGTDDYVINVDSSQLETQGVNQLLNKQKNFKTVIAVLFNLLLFLITYAIVGYLLWSISRGSHGLHKSENTTSTETLTFIFGWFALHTLLSLIGAHKVWGTSLTSSIDSKPITTTRMIIRIFVMFIYSLIICTGISMFTILLRTTIKYGRDGKNSGLFSHIERLFKNKYKFTDEQFRWAYVSILGLITLVPQLIILLIMYFSTIKHMSHYAKLIAAIITSTPVILVSIPTIHASFKSSPPSNGAT